VLEIVMRRISFWVTPYYSTDTPSGGAAAGTLGRAFDVWLERKLHEMFDAVAREPLPADLLSLVNQLAKKDAASNNDK
jgi:hypothetical protein